MFIKSFINIFVLAIGHLFFFYIMFKVFIFFKQILFKKFW